MRGNTLSISFLVASVLLTGGLAFSGEASEPDGASVLIVETEVPAIEAGKPQRTENKSASSDDIDGQKRSDGNAASITQKSQKKNLENAPEKAAGGFKYSNCALRDPGAEKGYSERQIYSLLLALGDSGAKAAKPFADSKDEIDKGARQAASTIIELQEGENARIREIMLKEIMDFDSGVSGFADEVAVEISPKRFEDASGRNILPFAARYHAIVVTLALDMLQFSRTEEARDLARDLIVEHADALAEAKELQQER